MAMYATQVIVALVQASLAIASSVMACKATCCKKGDVRAAHCAPHTASAGNVQYLQMGQAQGGGFMAMPSAPHAGGTVPVTQMHPPGHFP